MADSLDDFFAKKKSQRDKNKKFTTATTILKKLEETSRQSGQEPVVKKEKMIHNPNIQMNVDVPIMAQEEDDWKEQEEEKEIDYSGLRIQKLNSEKDDKEDGQSRDYSEDKEDDSDKNSKYSSGPWKALSGGKAPSTPAPVRPESPVPVEEPRKPAVYRPPSARNSSMSSNTHHGHKKRAPEISSEEHFPTLSSALDQLSMRDAKSNYNDKSFTSVKHGARSKGDLSNNRPSLDLENKYSALNLND